MDQKISRLRRQISGTKRDRCGRRRFSAELRAAVVELSADWTAGGGTQRELADTLGLSEESLSAWRSQARRRGATGQPTIRAVTLVDESPPASRPGDIAIVLPSGARIEGLDADAALHIARGLV